MNITKYHEDFMSLRENNIKVVGVWDDHDYGRNDGDITFKNKD
jgi:alkaline phosphatase D